MDKAIFVVRLNRNLGNSVSEVAFLSESKARNFFDSLAVDLEADQYIEVYWIPKRTNQVRIIRHAKFTKPSTRPDGVIDSATLTIKRLAFLD